MKGLPCAVATFVLVLLVSLRAQDVTTNASAAHPKPLPSGFVDLADIEPTILTEVRYATANNFVGAKVDGYQSPRIVMTRPAADALKLVQEDLREEGYGLKVFDAYRPQQAVNHFVRWARDLNDKETKEEYYPDVPKNELFRRGYIAKYSGHSRGSTIDLTLVDLETGEEVDMGTPFDFFDQSSWPYSRAVTPEQKDNRLVLRAAMKRRTFRPYDREWWHFTLNGEPYPRTYFDFPIE